MRPTAFGPEFATDDLTAAVEFGLLLAAFMFVERMADETKVDATFELSEEEAKSQSRTAREVPKVDFKKP